MHYFVTQKKELFQNRCSIVGSIGFVFCFSVVCNAHAHLNWFHKFLEGYSGSEAHSHLVVLCMFRFEVAEVGLN